MVAFLDTLTQNRGETFPSAANQKFLFRRLVVAVFSLVWKGNTQNFLYYNYILANLPANSQIPSMCSMFFCIDWTVKN